MKGNRGKEDEESRWKLKKKREFGREWKMMERGRIEWQTLERKREREDEKVSISRRRIKVEDEESRWKLKKNGK